MDNIDELQALAKEVDRILREELDACDIQYDMAEARIYNVRSVGVQGDGRTYTYPAEITLTYRDNFVWDAIFLERLSTRITNEVTGINRVVYMTAFK